MVRQSIVQKGGKDCSFSFILLGIGPEISESIKDIYKAAKVRVYFFFFFFTCGVADLRYRWIIKLDLGTHRMGGG